MKRNAALSALIALSLVLMLGLFACGSDEDSPTGPGQIGSSDQGTANALVFGVALPLIQNVFLGDYLDQLAAGTALPRLNACQPLDICSSGSAEFCDSPGRLDVFFYNCTVGGSALAGSLGLVVTNPTSGVASLDISVDGFDITGTVSYTLYDDCIDQAFNLVVSTTDANNNVLSITVTGIITYCAPYLTHSSGTIIPNYASLIFTVPALGRTVWVTVTSENTTPGDMEVLVQDLAFSEIYLLCHGNLFTGFSSCTDGS